MSAKKKKPPKHPPLSARNWICAVTVPTEGGGWSVLGSRPLNWKEATAYRSLMRVTGHEVKICSLDGTELPS